MDQIHLNRLRGIVKRIEDDPDCWDQSRWHCGTAHCVGGHAQIDAWGGAIKRHDPHAAFDDAKHWLGLTFQQARWLFASHRTLTEIRLAASALPDKDGNWACLDCVNCRNCVGCLDCVACVSCEDCENVRNIESGIFLRDRGN